MRIESLMVCLDSHLRVNSPAEPPRGTEGHGEGVWKHDSISHRETAVEENQGGATSATLDRRG